MLYYNAQHKDNLIKIITHVCSKLPQHKRQLLITFIEEMDYLRNNVHRHTSFISKAIYILEDYLIAYPDTLYYNEILKFSEHLRHQLSVI